MSKRKIVFIDRDGTLINEPEDKQIDSLIKLKLEPDVIPALLELKNKGFELVMVSNQDGLGTPVYPQEAFEEVQNTLMQIFTSQGILFDAVRICSHLESTHCECRKPKLGLVLDYLAGGQMDLQNSYVIGDRKTDLILAANMGISGILYDGKETSWMAITQRLTLKNRHAETQRTTKETVINIAVDLDNTSPIKINTGIGFFDHMLEQLAKHGGFSLQVNIQGDLHIDEHHTIEDTGLALGQVLKQALGDKRGIQRYGFLLPMDEALTHAAIDLSGRSYFVFEGIFTREKIGALPTELIPHFFRSLSESLGAAIHIKVQGENNHHMVESIFKGVGRSLRMAFIREGHELPTTKGLL